MARPRLGRRPDRCPRTAAHLSVSIAASSSATASSRRSAPAAAVRPSWPSTRPPPRRRRASRSRCPTTSSGRWPRRSTDLLAAEDLDGPDGDASRPDHGLARPVPRPRPAAARRGRRRRRSRSRPGRSLPPPGRPSRARPPPRRVGRAPRPGQPARDAQDDLARGLRLRPARGAPRRRGRRPLPDRSTATCPRARRPTSSSSGAPRTGRRACDAVARLRDPARHDPVVAPGVGRARRPAAVEGRLTIARPGARRRGLPLVQRRRGPAGDPVRRARDRRRAGRGRGRGARATDREAMIRGRRVGA